MQASLVGVTWYRPQDYARLKAMFPDGARLPDTFEGWLKSALNVCDKLTSEGFVLVKAYIDPDTFPEWCRSHGTEMDAKARANFANDFAAHTTPRQELE